MINDNSGSRVPDKVYNTILRHNLLPDKSRVLVAVSGGADSVCLLHILCGMRKTHGYKIYAAHLNHGIRGDEAARDEDYVKSLCDSLNVKLFVRYEDVTAAAKERGLTEEEAGRRARYEFFADVLRENNIDFAATAHNRDDQAETVIMRLIRGSGLSGMRGIKYSRTDGVVRPLLDVMRADIEQYCRENGLEYKTDSTNLNDDYTRNKIRHSVIPVLKEINPAAADALARFASSVGEDADFMDGYAKRLYARLGSPAVKSKYKALDIESLKIIGSRSVVSRLIILCAREAMRSDYSLEKKHIDMIIDFAESENSGSLDLPGGLMVSKNYGWLEFCLKDDNFGEKGLSFSNNSGFCIEVEPDKLYNIESGRYVYHIELKVVPKQDFRRGKKVQALDYEKVCGENGASLVLRSRRGGDRISVYKDGGSRKIKKLFIDLKIRREERAGIPLLCSGGEVLAVIGIRVSEKYKVTRDTKNVLVVNCEREELED